MLATFTWLDTWQALLALTPLYFALLAAYGIPSLSHGIACRLFSRQNMWDNKRCSHTAMNGIPRDEI